ncbi:MAG TPA: OmpA family protein, partial [Deltaproteobacteria bacterium]|nr:OmpA family protein [Deltaproteobacteria bacterium]
DLLGSILGDNAGGIGDLIASASGISKQSGTSLLGMLAPIVMGFLGKTLKTQGGLNAASLTNLLASQKDFVKAALPAGAANLLGVSDLGDLGQQAMQGAAAAGAGMKMWQWIAAIVIAILVILLLWRSCGKQVPVQETLQDTSKSVQEAVQDTTQRVEEQVGGAMAALGKFFTKKLPSGVALNIPEFGVENKLIAFIEDANAPVDEKTWFTFDRLTFETGKATLKPESQEQLKNIAEIMKAYPKVSIKLGGYTDNVGDPQANLQLSKARAEAVMADLVTLGIDAKRLQAEGYGQEHPVADNSTEEGRAKNRRIDLRVTAK